MLKVSSPVRILDKDHGIIQSSLAFGKNLRCSEKVMKRFMKKKNQNSVRRSIKGITVFRRRSATRTIPSWGS